MEKCGGAIDCPENTQSVKSHVPSKDKKDTLCDAANNIILAIL